MNAIKVKKLTKRYGKNIAVDNISFNVEEGDFYGFIGPNGAGKTTAIKTMLNLLRPTEGSVEILGNDISKKMFLGNVGYVPAEANLYEDLTVKNQINYFAKYYKNIGTDYISTLKKMFGVDDSKKIADLSLGNKKKVSIICALMCKPRLLIFDEVSSGLDPNMQKVLFDELKRLNSLGTTIFFSSHNLEEVQTYCQNVAIINKGKLVAKDNVQKLIARVGVRVSIKADHVIKLSSAVNLQKHISDFCKLPDGTVKFNYLGDINELVHYASHLKLEYFRIEDTKLEDIFTKYYGHRADSHKAIL